MERQRRHQRKEANKMAGGGGGDGEFGLQIAPMLDILFVLLLFFMVCTGSQKREAELGIKLPSRGKSQGDTPETPITLKIGPDNQVFFNDSPIDTPKSKELHDLQAKLVDIIAKFGEKQPIIITPSRTTRHERVVDVLNACSGSGIKNLSFGVPAS
jgi:biopolymer transport protein ExbD